MNKPSGIEERIIIGMNKVHERLLEEKKRTDSPIAVLRDNKVVLIKPWEEETPTS